MASPPVSIVMPVHNALPFLEESIRSILNQTFADFEFVMLNDSSTDGSGTVLREWVSRDSRIRLFESDSRLGLAGSSNLVVSKARASLVARMDADDLCAPERIQRQLQVMRDNSDVAVVGTLCDGIDASGKRIRSRDRSRILRHSLFPPFPHGSVMFRREIFDAVGGYRNECKRFEDVDLFGRIAAQATVVTLPEALYHFRYHQQNASSESPPPQSDEDGQVYSNRLSDLYFLGAMRLWSGRPPRILSDVLKPDTAHWSVRKLLITSWAAWAELHPASLRWLTRKIVLMRDLLAATRVSDGRFYKWQLE